MSFLVAPMATCVFCGAFLAGVWLFSTASTRLRSRCGSWSAQVELAWFLCGCCPFLGFLRKRSSSRLFVPSVEALSSFRCSPTASFCRILFLAFSRVSSASSCSCCERTASRIPTTTRIPRNLNSAAVTTLFP